jgi:hypothetical protein
MPVRSQGVLVRPSRLVAVVTQQFQTVLAIKALKNRLRRRTAGMIKRIPPRRPS